MRYWLIHNQLDLVLFAVGVLGLAFAVEWLWLKRQMDGRGFPKPTWALLAAIIVCGCIWAVKAGQSEQRRLEAMVSGFAPTYAVEMSRHGIDRINLGTAPDSAGYLELISLQKIWLKLNPSVADIYTFARTSDGQFALLVDSETDYDGNGLYEGEREARTPIGELYTENQAELTRAMAGEEVFIPEPRTDRWGTWITCLVPVRSSADNVIGVLGVDYPAERWVEAIFFRRGAVFSMAGIIAMILIGFSAAITIQRAEVDKRARVEALLVSSRQELSQLADALHARVEQRTQEVKAAQELAEQRLAAKDAELIEFCNRLRDCAGASAGPGTTLGAVLDDGQDLARLRCQKIEAAPAPASTLELITAAVAGGRARLNGDCRLDTMIATALPESVSTDGPQLARLLGRACQLVAGSQQSGTVHFDVSAAGQGTPQASLDFVIRCDCDGNSPGPSRLFASQTSDSTIDIGALGEHWQAAGEFLAQIGGRVVVSRSPRSGYEVHLSIPAGADDALPWVDPATCTARLAA